LPIEQTTALRKISALKKKIRVIRGGQGSGKTISILILLINHAASTPDREVLIISAELTKMRLTVIKDFVKVMKLIGIFSEHRFIAGTLYRFPNGSFIKFIGLDREDVGKGLRSDIAYFNEVNKCDYESYRQVATRAAKVIVDYNPDSEFFIDRDVIPREDADFLQLTFEDNEMLPQSERDEILNYYTRGYDENGNIKNGYFANLWQVYGLGNIGSLQGVVFNNWTQCEKMPEQHKWKAYGIDWGFTNDPTAVIEVCEFDGKLWLNEILYEKGLTNADIAVKIGGFKGQEFVADSAEPKSIEDLRRHGFRIRACQKGRDSVRAGIDKMQQNTLMVTSNSVNLIRELRGYVWATDKTGEQTGEPIDDFNHAIDAARYIIMEKLRTRSGQYAIR
jgi:phage terminase large subunit